MKYTPKKWPDRFWEKVAKGDGCWLWTAALNQYGYGIVQVGTNQAPKLMLAHRVAWELEHGPIPNGMKVLHRCDNPPCVRHLFLGSQADNIADMTKKGRHKGTRGLRLPSRRRH